MKLTTLGIYTIIILTIFLLGFGPLPKDWNMNVKIIFILLTITPWYITILIELTKIMKEINKENKEIENELKNI